MKLDGKTEVTNRALGDLLCYLVGHNIKSWGTKLCKAEFSHNHALNRSLGLSPFRVLYGVVPRCPLYLATLPDKTRCHGEALDFVNDLHMVHEAVCTNIEIVSAKYKATTNLKRRELLLELAI